MKKSNEAKEREAAQAQEALIAQHNAEKDAQLNERFGAKYQEWKKQYAPRKLNVIAVEDKVAILRPICAAEVSVFSMMVANPEMGLDKASNYLLNELWIDGDEELIGDEDYFISAMLQLQNVVELKKSNFYRL